MYSSASNVHWSDAFLLQGALLRKPSHKNGQIHLIKKEFGYFAAQEGKNSTVNSVFPSQNYRVFCSRMVVFLWSLFNCLYSFQPISICGETGIKSSVKELCVEFVGLWSRMRINRHWHLWKFTLFEKQRKKLNQFLPWEGILWQMETACVLVKLSLSLKILQQLFHRLAFYFENMPVFGTPSLNPAKQKRN